MPLRTVILNKPYGVLSRFTPDGSAHRTLADLGLPPGLWPVGRLDADSEGLLVLTADRGLQTRLLDPRHGHPRTYQVQVEGIPSDEALMALERGIVLDGRVTRPARAARLAEDPGFPPRVPPIRHRLTVPTTWIAITLTEGRNRQVRRMTAAVGHPTLRLVRVSIGALGLGDLAVGAWRELGARDLDLLRRR
jgi:23S rRNA pseudouridine2457 synthase